MEQIPTKSFTRKSKLIFIFLHTSIHFFFFFTVRIKNWSFETEEDTKVHTGYYLPTVEIKYFDVMIDRKDFLDQPVKRDMRTYDNVQKIATGQGDDSTAGCILDYNCFNNYFTMISIDSR